MLPFYFASLLHCHIQAYVLRKFIFFIYFFILLIFERSSSWDFKSNQIKSNLFATKKQSETLKTKKANMSTGHKGSMKLH